MSEEQIENVAFAIAHDQEAISFMQWIKACERYKKAFRRTAKKAIQAYKACLKEGV